MDAGATVYRTNLIFSRHQTLQALRTARQWGLDHGGLYEAQPAAIKVWLFPWMSPQMREESELVGTIHIDWGRPGDALATVSALEVQPDFDRHDVERHLTHLFGRPLAA